MQSISNILKKLSIFTILILVNNISYSAENDCVQTHTDGKINCLAPINTFWETDFANFPTKQTAINGILDYYNCTGGNRVCGNKTFVGDIDGKYCLGGPSSPYCANTSGDINNKSLVVYLYDYFTNHHYYSANKKYYSNFKSVCPLNTSEIGLNDGTTICYPLSGISAIDLQCSTSSLSPSLPTGKKAMMCPSQALTGQSVVGDPVSVTSGNSFSVESDYSYNSYYPLGYTRIYNNKQDYWLNNWNYSLLFTDYSPVGKVVVVTLPDGSSWSFKYNSSTSLWEKTSVLSNNKLIENNSTGEFTLVLENNNKIKFSPTSGTTVNNQNKWLASSMEVLGGGIYNLEYNNNNLLSKVINPDNIELQINTILSTNTYCKNVPIVTSITGPGSKTISYQYDTACRLTKVTYPDNKYKEYVYTYQKITEKDESGNVKLINSSIYSSTGIRKGKLTTSQGQGSSGLINKFSFVYNSNNTVVKNSLNKTVTIGVEAANSTTRSTSYSNLCSWCQGIQGSSISYNSNGYISSLIDFNSNETQINYNNQNLVTQIKQSVGNSLENQTDITYDSNYRLPATIIEPSGVNISGSYNNKTTTNNYDSSTGNILSTSIEAPLNNGTTNLQTRTWGFNYSSNKLTSITNPMYNSSTFNDKISFSYNSNGQINSVTNGLNQTTTFANFDSYGNPQEITYPNNTSLEVVYNSRGNVIEATKYNINGSQSFKTEIVRNDVQNVIKVILPSLDYKEFVYDNTQRLIEIKEYIKTTSGYLYNGKIVYTLDDMSKITKTQVLNASDVEIRLSNYQYNNLDLLYKDLTSLNYANTYTYDNNGNVTNINDANNKNYVYTYDSLNRVTTQTNPDNGVINYNYNPDNSIASIVDPKNLSTNYKYNGFGEIIELTSPDTGTTTISRNLNGDVTSTTDAKNITTSYSYDVLHRPISIDYPGTTEDVSITYDSCYNGVGKTCSLTDSVGSVNYSYDNFARLSSNNQTISSYNKTVSYSYDANNRLSKITYPSGLEVNYEYYNNKVNKVTYSISGNTYDLITDGEYETFDSNIKSYKYGQAANNISYNRVINKDGLTTEINTSVSTSVNKDYVYDTRLNVSQINGSSSSDSSVVGYDNNSRITSYDYGSNNIDYSYNSSGDRLSKTENTNTTNYNYLTNSHHLNSLSGSTTSSFIYDDNGNTVDNDNKNYTYNNANRLIGFTDNTQNYSYYINPLGQRIKKTNNNNSTSTYYVYDAFDRLIAEYDENDNLLNEYIYLNSTPIALRRSGNIYYIYPDDLGTPRHITDTSNNPKWSWDNIEPFGDNSPNESISGSTFKFNLRFPGQYYDEESELSYNYYRDYNSQIGRYNESDPIGLSAGINTYSYVDNNSLSGIDPLGLWLQLIHVRYPLTRRTPDHFAIRVVNEKMDIVFDFQPIDLFFDDAIINKKTFKEFVDGYDKDVKILVSTLNTTKKEETIMVDYYEELIKNKKNYFLFGYGFGNNCATSANLGLLKINKGFPIINPVTPLITILPLSPTGLKFGLSLSNNSKFIEIRK